MVSRRRRLQENKSNIDSVLLKHFQQEIWNKVPHLEKTKVVNATPLIDITEDLKECARKEYGLHLTNTDLQVFGFRPVRVRIYESLASTLRRLI